MSRQQNQAYLNLIQKLINCANKRKVNEILRYNFDDVDVDFLRMLQQEAVRLEQEGDSDKADFLRDIVNQLVDFLGIEEEDLKVAEVKLPKPATLVLEAISPSKDEKKESAESSNFEKKNLLIEVIE